MTQDFHDYEWKLGRFKERLAREAFSKEDQQVILDFIEHSRAQGVSAGRLYKLAWSLQGIRRLMKCDFAKADRKAIESLVADINSSPKWSANTKSDTKKILKRLYKFVRNGNADKLTSFPPEVSWISTAVKRNEVKEPDIITEVEAKRMIEAAPSSIDKSFIGFLYEGGFRISEALGMKVRDLAFDDVGARAAVHGKTGSRTVRLITSTPILAQFIDQHPTKNDESSALWYYFPTMRQLRPMNYRTACMILKRAATRAGLTKRIHPHLFRHSAATRDSSHMLNERLMEVKFGWSRGSRMAAGYTHIQDQQVVDDALLQIYAGKTIPKSEPMMKHTQCPRCQAQNSPGIRYCGRCGSAIDPQEVAKTSVPREAVEMQELRDQVGSLNKKIDAILQAHLEVLLQNADKLPEKLRSQFLRVNEIIS